MSQSQPRTFTGHQYFSVHDGGSAPRILHVSAFGLCGLGIDIFGLLGSVESEQAISFHFRLRI